MNEADTSTGDVHSGTMSVRASQECHCSVSPVAGRGQMLSVVTKLSIRCELTRSDDRSST